MKKSVIHIIQYESKGRHEDPIITFDDDEFLKEFENQVIAQGFRKKRSQETLAQYLEAYRDALDDINSLPEDCPNFNQEDTVRWYKIDVNVETLRQYLAGLGYFTQNFWSFIDLKLRAYQKFQYYLTDDQCKDIFDNMGRSFNPETGINWEVIDNHIGDFLQSINKLWIVRDEVLNQKYRKIDDFTYEFITEGREAKIINLVDYDKNDIVKWIQTFGYPSIHMVHELYGDSANMIIAECIFNSDL